MIPVDTSVWIDHLHSPEDALLEHLDGRRDLTHSLVVGELACGNLTDRTVFLGKMDRLPHIGEGTGLDVRDMVESSGLTGRGRGLMDAHLLPRINRHKHRTE